MPQQSIPEPRAVNNRDFTSLRIRCFPDIGGLYTRALRDWRREQVADAGGGLDVARVRGIGLDLSSQATDIDPDELNFPLIPRSPDLLQERLMCDRFARMAGQRA